MKKLRVHILFPVLLAAAAAGISGCSASLSKTSGEPSSKEQKASPSSESSDETDELVVFAAASLTEALEEIAEKYQEAEPDVSLVFNFDSSGTLKTQIQEGADCDLFLSASPKQMEQLEELDFILPESRINLLENKVVLVTPEGNDKAVGSFDSLAEHLKAGDILLAMGNSDVPVGQYTGKILSWYGLNEQELAADGLITYGSNVKEVVSQVCEGSVDAGVIYSTDAFSAGLTPKDEASEEMCGQVIYPASVLASSGHPDEAKAFLDFLSGPEAQEVFEHIGFSMAE